MRLTREQRDSVALRAQAALDDLRPFLEADGGDISLEEIAADGIARVKLHGACCGCAMSPMTMKAGVEEAIKRVAPEVHRVEAVNIGAVALIREHSGSLGVLRPVMNLTTGHARPPTFAHLFNVHYPPEKTR